MSVILVTGGTGFLGKALVRHLAERGARLRVLARQALPALSDIDIEWVRGSILDRKACREAVDGVSGVYHLAGLVSHDPKRRDEVYEIHVQGTERLLEALVEAGGAKVVLVSTSGTVGVSKDANRVATDDSPYAFEVIHRWPYYMSKVQQEEVTRRFARDHGVPVVIVRPSLLLGPGDDRLSSTRQIRDFLDRRIPVVPSGGLSYVDVRDAAQVLSAAMGPDGRPGQSYLVGARNLPIVEFMHALESVSGVRAPRLALPAALTRIAALALEGLSDFLSLPRGIDPVVLDMGEHFWSIDSSRAVRELGFAPRPLADTLVDTVRYVRELEPASSSDGSSSFEDESQDAAQPEGDLGDLLARRAGVALQKAREVLIKALESLPPD